MFYVIDSVFYFSEKKPETEELTWYQWMLYPFNWSFPVFFFFIYYNGFKNSILVEILVQ